MPVFQINIYYRRGSEFIRLPCPYRTVPYRFPRGTVLVDRTAYRTFVTVFRDFCLKARTQLRFKCSHFAVLTLIFRISAYRTETLAVFRDFNIINLNLMEFIAHREP
jgi:hypothetical protein